MRLAEAIPALFILVLAGFIFAGTAGLSYWDGPTPGARFFPAILAIAGTVVAGVLLWAQWRGFEEVSIDRPSKEGGARVAATAAALVGLAAGTPILGFVPMLALFMLVMLIGVLRQPWLPSALATLFVAGFVKLVFIHWLSVPLPMPIGI